jgi:(p)ppGpp synthase/HD superfamily hydrolase
MESFKLNLYQDEIYVFTPKGDLKILPSGSTPVDFAYEIHSKVGDHCLAAKVAGRIVPLDTALRSGDQVEIITSKKQTPNPDWEKFVVTHKAKSRIRRWIREEERTSIAEGKELWEKRVRKAKLAINDDDLMKFLHLRKIDNISTFYLGIRQGSLNADEIIALIQEHQKHPQPTVTEDGKLEGLFNRFISSARGVSSGIVLDGSRDRFLHNFAKCCNPIPGDDIVGFVTTGEGIKIHRRSCKNINQIMESDSHRLVEVSWPADDGMMYVSGVRITGDDRPGLLNDITTALSSYDNTNIRSVNIDSQGGMFQGMLVLDVLNTEHLVGVIERLKKVKGITRAERFLE